MKVIAATLLAAAAFVSADPAARIVDLPGWNDSSFDMYSGYINVRGAAQLAAVHL